MKLFNKILKKKELSELDLELKKYPKKRRVRMKELYDQYQKGMILKINEDIDNKEYILSKK